MGKASIVGPKPFDSKPDWPMTSKWCQASSWSFSHLTVYHKDLVTENLDITGLYLLSQVWLTSDLDIPPISEPLSR